MGTKHTASCSTAELVYLAERVEREKVCEAYLAQRQPDDEEAEERLLACILILAGERNDYARRLGAILNIVKPDDFYMGEDGFNGWLFRELCRIWGANDFVTRLLCHDSKRRAKYYGVENLADVIATIVSRGAPVRELDDLVKRLRTASRYRRKAERARASFVSVMQEWEDLNSG